jgi:CheY-like chemotaxis protein
MESETTSSEPLLSFVEHSAGPDSPITILLIDDDEDCRALLRDAIAECEQHHEVIEFSNGADAMAYLKQVADDGPGRPGLIFLDVEMPRMNGLEVLSAIKALDTLKDVPVVMMTGVVDEQVIRRAAALGANSYTVKPARAEDFFKTVMSSTHYWLRVHQYPTRHVQPGGSRR